MNARHSNLCLARRQAAQNKASGSGTLESQDLLSSSRSHRRPATLQCGWGRDLCGDEKDTKFGSLDFYNFNRIHLFFQLFA
jgi:hypothetical protein